MVLFLVLLMINLATLDKAFLAQACFSICKTRGLDEGNSAGPY